MMRELHRFPDATLIEWSPSDFWQLGEALERDAVPPPGHELSVSCGCGPWVYTDSEWGVKSVRHQRSGA